MAQFDPWAVVSEGEPPDPWAVVSQGEKTVSRETNPEGAQPQQVGKDSYDTALSDSEESAFQEWKKKYAPNDSGADYDLRGAFKSGLTPDAKTGHWPDTFKKPNHPTFSDQSIYAKDAPDRAGHWDGDTYVPAKGARPSIAERLSRNVAGGWRQTVAGALEGQPPGPAPGPPLSPEGVPLDVFRAERHQIPQRRAEAEKRHEQRMEEATAYEAMSPWYEEPTLAGKVEHGAAALAGQFIGQLGSPESYISAPAKGLGFVERAVTNPLARRVVEQGVTQAGVNVATDPAVQALNIQAGTQQEYDPVETALAAPFGFLFGAGFQGLHELASGFKAWRAKKNPWAEAAEAPALDELQEFSISKEGKDSVKKVQAAQSAPTAETTPPAGETIGLKYPGAPSRRVTIEQYFDNGESVRVVLDDGSKADLLTEELLRDRTAAPPPIEEPVRGEEASRGALTEAEAAQRFDEVPPQPSARKVTPRTPKLGAEAISALDQAGELERLALTEPSQHSTEQRTAMLTEAAVLRQRYQAAPENMAPTPAKDQLPTKMGPLGRAAVEKPEMFRPKAIEPVDYSATIVPPKSAIVPEAAPEPAPTLPKPAEVPAPQTLTEKVTQPEPAPPPSFITAEQARKALKTNTDPGTGRKVTGTALKDFRSTMRMIVQNEKGPLVQGPQRGSGGISNDASMLENIKRAGGIKTRDEAGNLTKEGQEVMGLLKDTKRPGLINNTSGVPADQMRGMFEEAGWFADRQEPGDIQHFYDAIDAEARGEKVYHPNSEAYKAGEATRIEAENARGLDDLRARADKMGVPYQSHWDAADIDAAITEREAMADDVPGLEPVADKRDAEFDASFDRLRELYEPLEAWSRANDITRATEVSGQPETPAAGAEGAQGSREPAARGEEETPLARAQGEGRGENAVPAARTEYAEEPGALDAQGKALPQTILPGTAKSEAQAKKAMSERQLAEMKVRQQQSKVRRGGQESAGGMFDQGRNQTDLLSGGNGSKAAPVEIKRPADVERMNEAPIAEPKSAEQADAGNYQKVHATIHGLPIAIENRKGDIRRNKPGSKPEWEVEMPVAYGYFKKSEGYDGDEVDVFVGDHPESDKAFVVNQQDLKTKKFDEHKVMLGFQNGMEARQAYVKSFSDGRGGDRIQSFAPITIEQLKKSLADGSFAKKPGEADIEAHIANAERAGVELSETDKTKIRSLDKEAKTLEGKAEGLYRASRDPLNKGDQFPLGVGFVRETKRGNQRIDASVRRAGEHVQTSKRAQGLRGQVDALLAGKGTDAETRAKAGKKARSQREIVDKLLTGAVGTKIGPYTIERVSNDRDGYPSSFTFTGEGIVKGEDKIDIVRTFFDGDKDALRKVVDEARGVSADNAPLTFESFAQLEAKMRAGDMTAPEAMAAFERVIASEAALKAELLTFGKDRLAKMSPRNRNETKQRIVDSLYSDFLNTFNAGGTYSWNPFGKEGPGAGIRKAMEKQTDADIKTAAEKRKQYAREMVQTYTNPQTLGQFESFIRARGKDKLSAEQRQRYDELVAGDTRATADREKAREQVIKKVDVETTMSDVIETKHTTKGHDLFVVQLADRVGSDKFKELSGAAKRLGGYYSSYRGKGAVPGFQFKTRDAAERFRAIREGDVSKADITEKRAEEVKENAITRLRDMADNMAAEANDSLNAERKVNTAKRARQAASAELDASANKALAQTMQKIADALEGGDVRHLDNIRTRADIETLETLVRNARHEWAQAQQKADPNLQYEKLTQTPINREMIDKAAYPYPYAHRETAAKLGRFFQHKAGVKRMATQLIKAAAEAERARRWRVVGSTLADQEMLHVLAKEGLKAPDTKYEAEAVLDTLKNYNRVVNMGFSNEPTLRAALREFLEYRGNRSSVDPIKVAERALIGTKIPGYFPTPPKVVDRMIHEAGITPGMKVLEPEAGKGNIADRLRDEKADVDTIEQQSSLRDILTMKGHKIIGADFLDHKEGGYDRIVMNPPFENGQDIDHVLHAYDLLKPDGRIVAIMSESPFFREDAKAREFRQWLDSVGGTSEKLPSGSFMDSDRSTGVATRLVVIDKSEEAPKFARGEGEAPKEARDYYMAPGRMIVEISDEAKGAADALARDIRQRLDRLGLHDISARVVDRVVGTLDGRIGNVDAYYFKKLITLGLDVRDKRATLDHEILHAIRKLGLLTDKEWAILERASKERWLKHYKIDELYPEADGAAKIEEGIAFAFSDPKTLRREPDFIRRVVSKVWDAIRAIGNAFRGLGFDTPERIFRRIESGEVGARPRRWAGAAEKPQFQTREGQPTLPPAGRDYNDHVADAMAEDSRSVPVGTYARALAQTLSGKGATKTLGWVPKHFIEPRALARKDFRSAEFWNRVKAKDHEASSNIHSYRELARPYLGLKASERKSVDAVLELDRLENRIRKDDGRRVVARNDGFDEAELSKPGQTVKLSKDETAALFAARKMFAKQWADVIRGSAVKFGWDGDPSSKAIRAEAAKLPAKDARALNRIGDLIEALESQERAGYVPLMRYGDYFIAVKKALDEESLGGFPEVVRFERVESSPGWEQLFGDNVPLVNSKDAAGVPKIAAKRIAELKAKYGDGFSIEHGFVSRNLDLLRQLDIPAIEKFLIAIEHKDKGLYEPLIEEARDQLYEQLKAGFKKRARTVPGYSPDIGRGIGSYSHWIANHVAELVHGEDFQRAYDETQKHPSRYVREFWQRWKQDDDQPVSVGDKVARGATSAAFYYTMAANPSSAIVTFDAPLAARAAISVGIGGAKTRAPFLSAMSHGIAAVRANTKEGIHLDVEAMGQTKEEKAFLADMMKRGELGRGRELAADFGALADHQAQAFGEYRTQAKKMLDISVSAFLTANEVSRAVAALTAYRLGAEPATFEKMAKAWGKNEVWRDMAKREGLNRETLARFLTTEGAFEWGRQNRAEWLGRHALGSIMWQFKQFPLKFLSLTKNLMVGMGPAGKAAAALMMTSLWAYAGVQGLPLVQDVERLYDWLHEQLTGEDPQIKASMYRLLDNAGLGKLGADIVMRGPVSVLFGADVSNRFGFGDLVSQNYSAIDFLGAAPSMFAQAVTGAWRRAASGQSTAAIVAQAAPAAVRNPLQAIGVYPQEGVKTQTGSQMLKPEEVGAKEKIARGLGFQPLKVSRAYDKIEYERRTASASDARVSRVYDRLATLIEQQDAAKTAKNGREILRIGGEINRVVKENSDLGLTPTTVRARVLRRRDPSTAAIKAAPKRAREQMLDNPYP